MDQTYEQIYDRLQEIELLVSKLKQENALLKQYLEEAHLQKAYEKYKVTTGREAKKNLEKQQPEEKAARNRKLLKVRLP